MTEEKETAKKEDQKEKEIDPLLNGLIDDMKTIKERMPDYEKEERITVFLEYRREKENHFGTEKQNMSNEKRVNIESLLNSLTFRTAKKNGDLKYAFIDLELAKKLPKKFEANGREYSVKTYENEKKSCYIRRSKEGSKTEKRS